MKGIREDIAMLGVMIPTGKIAAARKMTVRVMRPAIAMASALGIAFGPIAANAAMSCKNEVWNKIMSRHKLVVGVKPDCPDAT